MLLSDDYCERDSPPSCARTVTGLRKCDHVTLLSPAELRRAARWCYISFMTRRPAPISLRIRSAEATRNARKLLDKLEKADLLQRRVKWQASKALVAISEINSFAGSKLQRSGSDSDLRKVTEILTRISRRGI
jgi:hypothetical protein